MRTGAICTRQFVAGTLKRVQATQQKAQLLEEKLGSLAIVSAARDETISGQ